MFLGMDMNTGKEFYKFGRTERPIHKRVAEQGHYNKYLLICDVTNCKNTESDILRLLRNNIKIISRKDLGDEYFECEDYNVIKKVIMGYLLEYG